MGASVADGGDSGTDAAGTPPADVPYPAFTPANPQVVNSGGAVLVHPRLHPVFVGSAGSPYPLQAQVMQFLQQYVTSATWLAQVGEYGAMNGTVGPAIQIDAATLPASGGTGPGLSAWMQTQVHAGAWGASTTDDLYVLFMDQGRVVQLGPSVYLCGLVGGYHTDVQDATEHLTSVAVIPNCDGTIERVTQTASHELIEATTDPHPLSAPAFYSPSIDTPPDGAWAMAFQGGEIGDLCEDRTDNHTTPADVGFSIQRTWSNMAAMTGTSDPCVPVPAGSVYFNTYPVLPDVVMVDNGMGTINASGVILQQGSSVTVPVQFFSTAPTSGPWTVDAIEATMGAADLHFTWDHASGRNGDIRHLTIRATGDITGGRVFVITSTLHGVSTAWVGAVGTM